jgi:hypothetical protein
MNAATKRRRRETARAQECGGQAPGLDEPGPGFADAETVARRLDAALERLRAETVPPAPGTQLSIDDLGQYHPDAYGT